LIIYLQGFAMNFALRSIAAGALALAGVGAQAASFIAHNEAWIPDPSSTSTTLDLSFELLTAPTAVTTFKASVVKSDGSTYLPTGFKLFRDGTSGPVLISGPATVSGGAAGLLLSPAALTLGTYTLEFTAPSFIGAKFNITTSLSESAWDPVSSSPVPESGTLALALAGLGVLGFLGRRRSA
jgi:MYXO-CTERM domain-containing protein